MNDYERLKKLIGKEFDPEEIMSCMYDFNEMIIISKRNITNREMFTSGFLTGWIAP